MSRFSRLWAGVALVIALAAVAAAASTSHKGWPKIDGLLLIDKGPPGQAHTLRGLPDKHNELLGGYGNDTLYGGNVGDVLWSDYHPRGTRSQVTHIEAGDGRNFIYASHAANYINTGSNPRTVVHAHYGHGAIHCGSPKIVVYLSHRDRRRYRLFGCKRISYKTLGY